MSVAKTSSGGTPDNKELPALALSVLNILKRNWFEDLISPQVNHHMAGLLLAVYSFSKKGTPINTKKAWFLTGTSHPKTGMKYVAEAEALGLIVAERSSTDGRCKLLRPTLRLEEIVAKEFARMALDLQKLAASL